jgi:hypothetical protein
VNSFDIVYHLDSTSGFEDVSIGVSEKSSVKLIALLSEFCIDLYFLINVFLKKGVGAHQVSLIVLLEDPDAFSLVESLEGDSFSLDIGGYIGEIQITPALIKHNRPNILDQGELIVIDGDS